MSTIVGDIRQKLKEVVISETGYSELPFVRDIEKNDSRRFDKGYGVVSLGATETEGVTRTIAMDQTYELVLTRTVNRTLDESQMEDTIDDLHDKAIEIFKTALQTKLGLPGVLNVFEPSISAPEFLDEINGVALRFELIVKYSETLTL